VASVKKRLYELLIEYVKMRPKEVSPYLQQIKVRLLSDLKDVCLVSFRSDQNSLVKEVSLQLVIKILEHFNTQEIESIMKPDTLIVILLDEIKLRRPAASVKGTIWHLIGLLLSKYVLQDFAEEA